MKNIKNKYAGAILALCAAFMLASCAAAPVESNAVNDMEQAVKPSAEVCGESAPSAFFGLDLTKTQELEIDAADDTSLDGTELLDQESGDADRTDVHSASKDDGEKYDPIKFMHDCADYWTAKALAGVAGLQAKPEKYDSACVVDMRDDESAYDVDWDYGTDYEEEVALCDWSKVFDAEYYMDEFPMLALQYHYDEAQLLRHFQTAGVHEGRQGCEDFNVGAYMDWCAENRNYVADLFDGDYAMYYMYYMASVGEQPEKFPAGDRPAQYKAVLTKAQQMELDGINMYREKTGADQLVYDPEMAAFANYRCWVNQENEYVGHTWLELGSSKDVIDLYFDATSADCISENTLETSTLSVKPWYAVYADSKPHYDAMINTKYNYVGTSNLYVDEVAIKQYANRGVQFDIFAGSLSTPLNPEK